MRQTGYSENDNIDPEEPQEALKKMNDRKTPEYDLTLKC